MRPATDAEPLRGPPPDNAGRSVEYDGRARLTIVTAKVIVSRSSVTSISLLSPMTLMR
jgi:hypothetical protein